MNDIVTIYKGERGDIGTDGVNGTGVSDIRSSIVDNPILSCLHSNKTSKSGDVVYTKTGEALIKDRYGVWQFESDYPSTNEVPYSEDFVTGGGWNDTFSYWTVSSDQAESDPNGGNDATYITLDKDSRIILTNENVLEDTITGLDSSAWYTLTFYIKVVSGTFTGMDIQQGSTHYPIEWTPSSSWQKIRLSFGHGGASSLLGINPWGASGAVFGIFAVQYSKGSSLIDYIKTTGTPISNAATSDGSRSNDLGYLIESSATNLITYSEDLSKTGWSVSGAALAAYTSENPFGNVGQQTQLTFSGAATATVSKTATVLDNTKYIVSFYIKLISGNITQINAAIQDGAAIDFALPTSDFERVYVEVTSGTSVDVDLVISAISPEKNAVFVLVGVQVETGSLSSYIRTAASTYTRSFDDYSVPFSAIKPDDKWALQFTQSLISNDTGRYIFSNELSGSDELSSYYTSSILYINIGGVLTSFSDVSDANEVGLSFGSGNIKLFKDGVYVETKANAGSVSTAPTSLAIGSDGVNAINAYLGRMIWYNETLTDSEMSYISGVN